MYLTPRLALRAARRADPHGGWPGDVEGQGSAADVIAEHLVVPENLQRVPTSGRDCHSAFWSWRRACITPNSDTRLPLPGSTRAAT